MDSRDNDDELLKTFQDCPQYEIIWEAPEPPKQYTLQEIKIGNTKYLLRICRDKREPLITDDPNFLTCVHSIITKKQTYHFFKSFGEPLKKIINEISFDDLLNIYKNIKFILLSKGNKALSFLSTNIYNINYCRATKSVKLSEWDIRISKCHLIDFEEKDRKKVEEQMNIAESLKEKGLDPAKVEALVFGMSFIDILSQKLEKKTLDLRLRSTPNLLAIIDTLNEILDNSEHMKLELICMTLKYEQRLKLNKLEAVIKSINGVNDKSSQIEEKFISLKNELEKSSSEKDNLFRKVSSLQEEVKDLTKKNEEISKKLSEIADDNSHQQNRKPNNFNETLDKLRQENDEIKRVFSNDLDKKEITIRELRSKIDELEAKNSSQEQIIIDFQKNLRKGNQMFESNEEEEKFKKESQNKDKAISGLKKDLELADLRNNELEEKVKKLETSMNTPEKEKNSTLEIVNLKREMENLHSKCLSQTEEIKSLEKKINKLKDLNETLTDDKEKSHQEAKNIQSKLKDCESKLNQELKNNKIITNEKDKAIAELEEKKRLIASKEREFENLQQKYISDNAIPPFFTSNGSYLISTSNCLRVHVNEDGTEILNSIEDYFQKLDRVDFRSAYIDLRRCSWNLSAIIEILSRLLSNKNLNEVSLLYNCEFIEKFVFEALKGKNQIKILRLHLENFDKVGVEGLFTLLEHNSRTLRELTIVLSTKGKNLQLKHKEQLTKKSRDIANREISVDGEKIV